jgi:hypothetical protein
LAYLPICLTSRPEFAVPFFLLFTRNLAVVHGGSNILMPHMFL